MRRGRIFVAVILAAAVYLSATAVFGDRGLLTVRTMRIQAAEAQAAGDSLAEENTALRGQVKALREDEGTIEQIAREEHGYLRKGETIYQFDGETD